MSGMRSTRNPARTVPQGALTPTPDGAAWLASASKPAQPTFGDWADPPPGAPGAPVTPAVLTCGSVFDVVNAPAIFGRRMLDRLWGEGPGSGPVAAYQGRMLLFAAPGTAQRLPSLLKWEEWGSDGGVGRSRAIPPLLCHGKGDAVTVPPLSTAAAPEAATAHPPTAARWLVAPDTRQPWLPGPEVLLWVAVRAARTQRVSSFPPADQGAKVYDISRRR